MVSCYTCNHSIIYSSSWSALSCSWWILFWEHYIEHPGWDASPFTGTMHTFTYTRDNLVYLTHIMACFGELRGKQKLENMEETHMWEHMELQTDRNLSSRSKQDAVRQQHFTLHHCATLLCNHSSCLCMHNMYSIRDSIYFIIWLWIKRANRSAKKCLKFFFLTVDNFLSYKNKNNGKKYF